MSGQGGVTESRHAARRLIGGLVHHSGALTEEDLADLLLEHFGIEVATE